MNSDQSFFGHPKGLSTLFFTEMWERFSYYGMRAILLLYMVASVENGGMGLDDQTGGAIYGLYTMFVYLLALPGGWLADKFFGLRKSVFYGGCIIAAGHFSMAIPLTETFFTGLLLIVIGTGLLKPNISTMVGELYPSTEQARRDAGFSIFYAGINLGAALAPIVTGYLGEKVDWHYGFGVAGVGMLIGLIQYKLSEKNLGSAGALPNYAATNDSTAQKRITIWLWVIGGGLGVLLILLFTNITFIDPLFVAKLLGYIIPISAIAYFIYVLLFENLSRDERRKVLAIAIFFITTGLFYAGYEQQGSSLNLFAKRYTDMFIGDFEMPASWMQTVPPVAVIIFSIVFAWLWVWLDKRKMNPSTPVKMSFGLIFMGLGYAVMMGASMIVIGGDKPLPTWLVATYLLHTFGEICLYPVGLSAVTKLSPKKLVGQLMGVFFIALAYGNLIAGLFAGEFDEQAIEADPSLLLDLFGVVMKVMLISGIIVLIFSKPIRKLMGNIR
ncbi:MAG TPA: peptide MFS transporter [Chryseosolibacter sp.]|nr:peptide MFS transporter [Chryseosolibacter sp.]